MRAGGEDDYVNSGTKPRPPLPAGPFLVVGLARSGAAIARVLAERGETVLGVDSGHPDEAAGLEQAGVEVSLGVDGTRQLDRARTLVKSPGVPQDAPVVQAARERGIEVTGELELAWRLIPNDFCAVTGTNGKTTTTELIGHLYRTAGRPVAVAGNVGTPLASLVGAIDPDATVVCEASSFQLEDTDYFSPECAVFINLAPDHLDRHGTLENYLAAKLRIFANQGNDDVAVYNGRPQELRGRDLGGCARLRPLLPRRGGGGGPRLRAQPARRRDLRGRGAADPRRRAAAARGPQRRERDGGGRGGARLRPSARRRGGGAAELPGRPPPPRAGPGARRRPLRERLEGDQRGLGAGRDPGVRRRRPADRRRAAEAGELRAAGPGGRPSAASPAT